MINDYLVYIVLALTITAIPGPAVVLTIKNSLTFGYRASIANIFGNFIAMIILSSLSALGLGAIIIASSTLFTAVKILGCIYLVYLGIKIWMTSPLLKESIQQLNHLDKRQFASMFKEGFAVGMSNPKAIAFFTALFPQFIDPSRAFVPQFLTLILTIEGISFLVLSSYALLSSKASCYISRQNTMAVFNKLTGTAFIGFGLALLYQE